MTEKSIEQIVYRLKQSKEDNKKGAIVFLGAGCSVSGGIPRASILVKEILDENKENPDIQQLIQKNPTPDYAELMECLNPRERNKLFKKYVEQAKVNASHIYLAHLLKEEFVDYIVTVNFDNLAQRALALHNIFPPIYDISILRDITTTTLEKQSIIHLHGHYNGLWQLNTKEEMRKVNEDGVAKSIFDRISHDRPWIIIGYSGDDFIFDELIKYKRFDNDLFWIGYKDSEPSDRVKTKLLDQANCGAYLTRGYDSDSFFLKLSSKLCSDHPKIFSSPFSFLSELYSNLKDIEDEEHYKGVKERFEDSKRNVQDAIKRYEENTVPENQMSPEQIKASQLKQLLVECITNEDYSQIEKIEQSVFELKDDELLNMLNLAYFNWGNGIGEMAKLKRDEEKESLLLESIEIYQKAHKIDVSNIDVLNNLGNRLGEMAKLKRDEEKESLLLESLEKYQLANKMDSNNVIVLNNWGNRLGDLVTLKQGEEKESLLLESIEKFEMAYKIDPNVIDVLNNWGNRLGDLANLKQGEDKESLLLESLEKYQLANKIDSNDVIVLNNLGNRLGDLANLKQGEDKESLLLESLEKLELANKIDSNNVIVLNNLGNILGDLAKLKQGEEKESLLLESLEKYQLANKMDSNVIDVLNNWGNILGDLAKLKQGEEKESLLLESLEKYESAYKIDSRDFNILNNWGNILGDLAKLKQGEEKESLLLESLEKYESAYEIDSKDFNILNNWGNRLGDLAELKQGEEKESLLIESLEKYESAYKIDSKDFNILNNWGNRLGALAKLKQGEEKESLLHESLEKYQAAFRIDSSSVSVLFNWGISIGELAALKQGEEKESLLLELVEKYQTAYKIESDNVDVLNSLGIRLGELAALKQVEEKRNLLLQARDILLKVKEINGNEYNLACCYVLLGEKENAFTELKECLEKGLIDIEHVKTDEDWNHLREKPEYLELVERFSEDS